MTPEWKEEVRRKLEEMGKNHRWLESEIGSARGSVTKMLSEGQHTSSLVGRVCKRLGIAAPLAFLGEDIDRELAAAFKDATPEEKRAALSVLLLSSRKRSD
jgi:hypothetical protein